MKRSIPWLCCVAVLISACGGTQSSSEQPEVRPATVATVEVSAHSPDQADKRERDREIAENAGMLGVLADAGALAVLGTSGFHDDGDAIGAMWGDSIWRDSIGESFGAGGLGLSGTGRGGGGSGEGTIGLGRLGTAGRGGGGTGAGYGPRLTQGNANVVGALDKDDIRRVIRSHLNQFKYCYQRRLTANPKLQGKVVTRFTISPAGTVAAAQDARSTMPDPEVTSCVQRVFKRLRFPQPKGGGVVVVTYPLIFVPAPDANADAGAPDAAADAPNGG